MRPAHVDHAEDEGRRARHFRIILKRPDFAHVAELDAVALVGEGELQNLKRLFARRTVIFAGQQAGAFPERLLFLLHGKGRLGIERGGGFFEPAMDFAPVDTLR